jgi:hypothetical protein
VSLSWRKIAGDGLPVGVPRRWLKPEPLQRDPLLEVFGDGMTTVSDEHERILPQAGVPTCGIRRVVVAA